MTDDSAGGRGCTRRSTDPLARERIGWSEAAAHRGIGDLDGRGRALRGARRAGHRASAPARASSPDSASRAVVRRDLVGARCRAPEPGRSAGRGRACSTAPSRRSRRPRSSRSAARPPRRAATPARPTAFERRLRRAGLGTADDRFAFATDAHPARPPRRCGAGSSRSCARRASWPPPPPTSAPGRWSAPAQLAPGRTALARVLRATRATRPPPPPPSFCWAISPRTTAPTRAPAATIGRSSPAIPAAGSRRRQPSARR